MKSKIFDYRKIPNHAVPKKHWIKRPMLQLTLINGTKRQQVVCLVDSGADESLFHTSIAENLGIELETGIRKTFNGISGSIYAYAHKVEIEVQGFERRVGIDVNFTDSDGVHAILGQRGFFENFEVCFKRYRGRIEITERRE